MDSVRGMSLPMLTPDTLAPVSLDWPKHLPPLPSAIRVGVLGDGKCLLHAILYLTKNEYIQRRDLYARTRMAHALIGELQSHITMDLWLCAFPMDILESIRKSLEPVYAGNKLDPVFIQWMDAPPKSIQSMLNQCKDASIDARIVRDALEKQFCEYVDTLPMRNNLTQSEGFLIADMLGYNLICFDSDGKLWGEMLYSPNHKCTIALYNSAGVHWEPILFQDSQTEQLYRFLDLQIRRPSIPSSMS